MSPIPFQRIKLFKGPEIAPRRAKSAPPAKPAETGALRAVLRSPVPPLLLFAAGLALLISYLPSRSLASLSHGAIAEMDIVAPADLTIEDLETTGKRRREAEEAVLPVYIYDVNVFLTTEDKIRKFFDFGRDWLTRPPAEQKVELLQAAVLETFGLEIPVKDLADLVRAKFARDLEETLIGLLGTVSNRGIVLSKNLFILGEPEHGFTLVRANEGERSVRAAEILDIKDAKDGLAAEIERLDVPPRTRVLLRSLTGAFIAPNVTYNKVETTARKEKARAAQETVFFTIKKGKVLIRKGDEAGAETVRLVNLINEVLRTRKSWLANFAGTFLLIALLLATLWAYLQSNLRRDEALRKFLMMGALFMLSLLVFRLSGFLAEALSERAASAVLSERDPYFYVAPFQMGTLVFAFLTPSPIALIYAILNSLFVGYLFGANFYLMIFSFVGSLAAIYGVRSHQRLQRAAVLRSAVVLIAPVNVFVILTIHLIRERLSGLDSLAFESLMGALGAAVSGVLAYTMLPVVESVFGFVTSTKLLELTNSDLPILRRLAMEAPGSYHHSLIVSTLAEKAAEEIKADGLLAKAGALYHDIGKLRMPDYFIENKTREDIHRELSPSMSTLVIINHVKEGLEVARRLRLPKGVRDIIEQHHGTSLVRFFYQKAKEKYDPEVQKVGEESYRYPGPVPQTKEAAIVMLADSVEAACRSLKMPTLDHLKRVITDIFNNYLQDGQLDASEFSLRELRAVAGSFLSILHAVYHPRVDYPGFEFEKGGGRKTPVPRRADVRNHQPAK